MTASIYLKKSGVWEDVTDDYVLNATFEDKGQSALNKLTVDFDRSILGTSYEPQFQTEIKLVQDSTDTFAGKIDRPVASFPYFSVVAYTYSDELLDTYINETFTSQTVEQIVAYIISHYTGLTYVAETTSGITIDKITFKDQKIDEVMDTLTGIYGYICYTDTNKVFHMIEKGSVSSGKTLTVGTEIINQPAWDKNTSSIVTKVIVEGDVQLFNTSETFTATAGQQDFTVTKQIYGNVTVTVAGTLKTPQVTGSNNGDYTVNTTSKLIHLLSGATVGQSVVITYSYAIPIKITMTQNVQDEYGNPINKQVKITNKSIQSYQEARKFGRQYLETNSQATYAAEVQIVGFDPDITAGKTIKVIDETEGINQDFLILQTSWSLADYLMTIKIGPKIYEFQDWQKEVMKKLKDLANSNQNQDLLQYYDSFPSNLKVSLQVTLDVYAFYYSNSFLGGHVTLGRARASDAYEPDCAGYPTSNGHYGTFTGTKISGSYYNSTGFKTGFWSMAFNGSDIKCTAANSVSGVKAVTFAMKDQVNSRDILQLASGKYISLDGSGNITSTGLTNFAATKTTIGSWTFVYATFDSITADAIILGYRSTYFSGYIDELQLWDNTLSAGTQSDLQAGNFDQLHADYSKCLMWWSGDNPVAGDNSFKTLIESQ